VSGVLVSDVVVVVFVMRSSCAGGRSVAMTRQVMAT